MTKGTKIALLDSGGKDCKLAYELVKDKYNVDYFITFVENGLVSDHFTVPKPGNYLIDLTGVCNSPEDWFKDLTIVSSELKKLNVGTLITGAIRPIPEVALRMAADAGIELVCPILGWDRKRVIEEVLRLGIKAKIVSVVSSTREFLHANSQKKSVRITPNQIIASLDPESKKKIEELIESLMAGRVDKDMLDKINSYIEKFIESNGDMPPLSVVDNKFEDGAHRLAAIITGQFQGKIDRNVTLPVDYLETNGSRGVLDNLIGRVIDEEFMNSSLNFDLCGENGEYHTEVL